MSFYPRENSKEYWFMVEKIGAKRNLRLLRLDEINRKAKCEEFKIALRDLENDVWTKWTNIFHNDFNIFAALDVHRSMVWNEIVLESDYEDYEKNYEAARIMGAILEDKGFKPMYYYSGNKSIHIHLFLDFESLTEIDLMLQELIMANYTRNTFFKEFMLFLRLKAARFWGIKARQSDEQVAAGAKHLIRAELSMHKKGFKTFLGYTYKDLFWIPPIYNFTTKTLPELGNIVLSKPNDIQALVEEFLKEKEVVKGKKKTASKIRNLNNWLDGGPREAGDIRKCVKLILNPDLRLKKDGANRAFFILFNELKKVYDLDKAKGMIEAWNLEMGEPMLQKDIDYRANTPVYTLSDDYIHSFLASCGYEEREFAH